MLISSKNVNAGLSADEIKPVFSSINIYNYQFFPGALNMALDYFLAQQFEDTNTPIFRFYGWQPSCISIGVHQTFDLLDLEKINDHGLEVVRRPTGGRTILHANELTYSFIISRKQVHHKSVYRFIHEIILKALLDLGYAVEMAPGLNRIPNLKNEAEDFPCFTHSAETEIQHKGRKVVGSAQKLFPNVILQHGSILIGPEHENLADYFKTTDKVREYIKSELKNKTQCLNRVTVKRENAREIVKSIIKQLEFFGNISLNCEPIGKSVIEKAVEFTSVFTN